MVIESDEDSSQSDETENWAMKIIHLLHNLKNGRSAEAEAETTRKTRELVSIEMQKTHIVMNKPIIVGMCVLELSKVLMYSFL